MNNTKPILDSLCCNHAAYQLTKEEEKVVFWLIEQLDLTKQKGFEVQIVPIKTLRDLLLITTDINLADTILTFIAQIGKKGIEFKTDIEIDDKPFFGYINWFQSIAITKNEKDKKHPSGIYLAFFSTGFLLHFVIEYLGINCWYCDKKCSVRLKNIS